MQSRYPHELRLATTGEGGFPRLATLEREFAQWQKGGGWFRMPSIQQEKLVRAVNDGPERVTKSGRLKERERAAGIRSMHGYPKASRVKVTKVQPWTT